MLYQWATTLITFIDVLKFAHVLNAIFIYIQKV